MKPKIILTFLLTLALLSACSPAKQAAPPAAGVEAVPASDVTPAPLPTQAPTITLRPTDPPAAPTTPPLIIHSPLQGLSFTDTQAAVVNPYNPPPAGSDDPHHGVDLAIIDSGIALAGQPVQAVLPGVVTAVIVDRFPYGNALIIEIPLSVLTPEFLTALSSTPQRSTVQNSALTCVQVSYPWQENTEESLYILYAHLLEAPALEPGDSVTGGEAIGSVGSSGNALNPHLHLETRIGPSGASFVSMAHYDPSASSDEMAAYCTWRISSTFSLLDPMLLLAQITVE